MFTDDKARNSLSSQKLTQMGLAKTSLAGVSLNCVYSHTSTVASLQNEVPLLKTGPFTTKSSPYTGRALVKATTCLLSEIVAYQQ